MSISRVIKLAGAQFLMVRDGENVFVPDDLANRDRRAIDDFVSAGGKIEVAGSEDSDPPPEGVGTGSGPVVTYKVDVWRRATPDQVKIIDQSLNELDTRMRRLWDDAQYLDHASEEFGMLRQAMVEAFGEEAAAALLAPS